MLALQTFTAADFEQCAEMLADIISYEAGRFVKTLMLRGNIKIPRILQPIETTNRAGIAATAFAKVPGEPLSP